ncbi:MAG: tRNA 2-selenouridine(34) synthase MnmH [Paracoccus sp. (in: a-proteobacteria)]|nr:tRNA 2-selenouridine(34) synthase MnmH [Paracoccus sp. (in: a-proteobacteria)]
MSGTIARLRLDAVAVAGFDDVIDVRAPAEYAQDHLPGAISLPVLDDAERARVGTIYKQVSPFDARKIGAALVAANAARHLAGPLADRPGGWQPLIYCWRGGQRSGSFASILAQIGWRVTLVEGGYKSWRRQVVARVQERGIASPVVVLDGNTGSAKTAILHALARRGVQIIDLEGLAHHRGSLFGATGPQPAQTMFEGRLAAQIEALDPARPVVIEAESSRIGALNIPRAVWAGICAAPRVALSAPLEVRAGFVAEGYADLLDDPARVEGVVARLAPLHPAARIAAWQAMARAGAWRDLAAALMREHYDPRYARQRARHAPAVEVVELEALDDADRAAGAVEAALMRAAAARPAASPQASRP